MDNSRPRDLIGYGRRRPQADWPHKARIALSFVLNYEEGGEHNVMDGDPHAEIYVTPEMTGMLPVKRRNFSSEEMFEYGSRSGFWRLLKIFADRAARSVHLLGGRAGSATQPRSRHRHGRSRTRGRQPFLALDRLRRRARRPGTRGHPKNCTDRIRSTAGSPPLGWYTGRFSPNTRRLVIERVTETLYNSDSYNDDLPYWTHVAGKPRLIVPYALDTNDFKFALCPGWTSGDDFFTYLKAAFDYLYREGETSRR